MSQQKEITVDVLVLVTVVVIAEVVGSVRESWGDAVKNRLGPLAVVDEQVSDS